MVEEIISGEEHRARQSSHQHQRSGGSRKSGLMAAAGLIVLGVGFFGGITYQKDHIAKTTLSTSVPGPASGAGGGFGGRRSGGQRPTFGQVTAISATSITIAGQSGANTTLAITMATTITSNGQTVASSSIKVGDTVAVIASSTDSTQAVRILVNPSFGGGGGAPAPAGTTTD